MKFIPKAFEGIKGFELATLFVFVAILVGQFSVTKFAEGYYSRFDLTLPEINFVPEVYDYVNVLPLTLGVSAVFTFLLVIIFSGAARLGVLIADVLLSLTGEKYLNFAQKHRSGFEFMDKVLESTFKVVIAVVSVISILFIVNMVSYNAGESKAQKVTSFKSISSEGDNIQKVIIYKNDGEIILKAYSASQKKFTEGYETIIGEGYRTRLLKFN